MVESYYCTSWILLVVLCVASWSGGLSFQGGSRLARSRRRGWERHRNNGASAGMQMSGLFGEQDTSTDRKNFTFKEQVDWHIYIDQSKASLDRGGSATLDAFCTLSPPDRVQIVPSILPKSNKKGPWIRCIFNRKNSSSRRRLTDPGGGGASILPNNLDVGNVDSVDKVYRVLTKHLQVKGVSLEACECLKWKYKGNSYRESGNVGMAINSYNMALLTCRGMTTADSNESSYRNQQEGVILLLRASAYLQQAQFHKEVLQKAASEWKLSSSNDIQAVLLAVSARDGRGGGGGSSSSGGGGDPQPKSKGRTSSTAATAAAVGLSVLNRLKRNGSVRRAPLRRVQYRHGLYQISLLQAAQDSLRATEIVPGYSTSWLQAGELLSDLWKIKESRQYYEKAVSIDTTLADSLGPMLQQLEQRQRLLDTARASKEWPEDLVRLALDVAG